MMAAAVAAYPAQPSLTGSQQLAKARRKLRDQDDASSKQSQEVRQRQPSSPLRNRAAVETPLSSPPATSRLVQHKRWLENLRPVRQSRSCASLQDGSQTCSMPASPLASNQHASLTQWPVSAPSRASSLAAAASPSKQRKPDSCLRSSNSAGELLPVQPPGADVWSTFRVSLERNMQREQELPEGETLSTSRRCQSLPTARGAGQFSHRAEAVEADSAERPKTAGVPSKKQPVSGAAGVTARRRSSKEAPKPREADRPTTSSGTPSHVVGCYKVPKSSSMRSEAKPAAEARAAGKHSKASPLSSGSMRPSKSAPPQSCHPGRAMMPPFDYAACTPPAEDTDAQSPPPTRRLQGEVAHAYPSDPLPPASLARPCLACSTMSPEDSQLEVLAAPTGDSEEMKMEGNSPLDGADSAIVSKCQTLLQVLERANEGDKACASALEYFEGSDASASADELALAGAVVGLGVGLSGFSKQPAGMTAESVAICASNLLTAKSLDTVFEQCSDEETDADFNVPQACQRRCQDLVNSLQVPSKAGCMAALSDRSEHLRLPLPTHQAALCDNGNTALLGRLSAFYDDNSACKAA
eukprot:TRINITY_DN21194_c0_g1_i1.p1 TRINITY_DN21194_c0_g1~~TRINITY_DN21194_c0_g1_i1.p1  ORF type:complete len:583 (+),score=80.48 TRINITY_DN21194_c0_g1_i1:150-1898(+)